LPQLRVSSISFQPHKQLEQTLNGKFHAEFRAIFHIVSKLVENFSEKLLIWKVSFLISNSNVFRCLAMEVIMIWVKFDFIWHDMWRWKSWRKIWQWKLWDIWHVDVFNLMKFLNFILFCTWILFEFYQPWICLCWEKSSWKPSSKHYIINSKEIPFPQK
jgi:hypothetical protein